MKTVKSFLFVAQFSSVAKCARVGGEYNKMAEKGLECSWNKELAKSTTRLVVEVNDFSLSPQSIGIVQPKESH